MNLLTAQGMDLETMLDTLESRQLQDCKDAYAKVSPDWGNTGANGILVCLIGVQTTPAQLMRDFLERRSPSKKEGREFRQNIEMAALSTECVRRSITDKDLFAFCFPKFQKPPAPKIVEETHVGNVSKDSRSVHAAIREPAHLIATRLEEMGLHFAIVAFPKDESKISVGMVMCSAPPEELLTYVSGFTESTQQGFGLS